MKLNKESQLGLGITKGIVDKIFYTHWDAQIKNLDSERQSGTLAWLLDLFSSELKSDPTTVKLLKEKGMPITSFAINKNYLIAKTALDMAERIKIHEDKFDVKFLSKVKDQKITFLLGANKLIRYVKKNGMIFGMQIDTRDIENVGKYMDYHTFKINTITGDIDYANKPVEPLTEPNFKLFVQLLVFTELSKLEVKVLEPNQKTGTRKEGKYINDSNKQVIVVNSVWNKMVVRTTGFQVSGHWRLQRFGKDFSEAEYIFIEPFMKNGYIRMPKKETSETIG